ncbi:MAG TPA: A/G-specific adenine glycosylase [Clostridiales bacterium]|nr:A/G-specific adenine glycosylase [Clostridiales bacterium]
MKIQLKDIVTPLLAWYDKHARKLPWRDDPAPYRVWVSEIMLQQTRVEAVKPYFDRFLRELPDIHALANAPEEQLLKLWEGLGYYNRAHNLQKAAIVLEEQYGGALPASYEALCTLPGIGGYTAGAIASIAFGLPHPAVDGNVLRVLSRIWADASDILQASVKKAAERALAGIIPQGRAGDFTQAMMELGALVCLPGSSPRCGECPLNGLCAARQYGIQGELPVKKPKQKRRGEKRTVFVVTDGRRLLLSKREQKGLLAGLWELPSVRGHCGQEEARAWLKERSMAAQSVTELGQAKHVFTHVEWLMRGYLIHVETAKQWDGAVWASREQITAEYAIPSAFSTYLKYFMDGYPHG